MNFAKKAVLKISMLSKVAIIHPMILLSLLSLHLMEVTVDIPQLRLMKALLKKKLNSLQSRKTV